MEKRPPTATQLSRTRLNLDLHWFRHPSITIFLVEYRKCILETRIHAQLLHLHKQELRRRIVRYKHRIRQYHKHYYNAKIVAQKIAT